MPNPPLATFSHVSLALLATACSGEQPNNATRLTETKITLPPAERESPHGPAEIPTAESVVGIYDQDMSWLPDGMGGAVGGRALEMTADGKVTVSVTGTDEVRSSGVWEIAGDALLLHMEDGAMTIPATLHGEYLEQRIWSNIAETEVVITFKRRR